MKTLLIWMLKVYRYAISPLLGNHCRFHPSCSVYAMQALSKYGFVKGSRLAAWRILRCNPWHPGGYDPLP